MYLYIRNAGALILIVCLTVLSVEFYLRLNDNSPLKYQTNYYSKNKNNAVGIILGPSHAYRSINPLLLNSNVISLAIDGSALNVDYQIFKKIKEDLISIKFILIDLSAGYLEKTQDYLYYKKFKLPYYWKISTNQTSLLEKFLLIDFPIKSNFRAKYNSFRLKGDFEINKAGFYQELNLKNSFKSLNYRTDLIKNYSLLETTLNKHNKLNEASNNDNSYYLKNIIKHCNVNNIDVIFISPPKYYLYNKGLMKEHFKRRKEFLHSVKTYKNVYFWDFEDFESHTPEYFFNYNHMNPKGAGVFTKHINNRINNHLLKKAQKIQ